MATNFFTPFFSCCIWIRDPGWVKIRIQDKHPGSATLVATMHMTVSYLAFKCWGRGGGLHGSPPITVYTLSCPKGCRTVICLGGRVGFKPIPSGP
jgi:hypothetical protein